jgi:hypothetical protein
MRRRDFITRHSPRNEPPRQLRSSSGWAVIRLALGLVGSFNHPGGNITGIYFFTQGLEGKLPPALSARTDEVIE